MPAGINCRAVSTEWCDAIRFDSNRYETNRIFIAFISESIEKFTALEILSGTLQFTCKAQEYWRTQTHTDTDTDSDCDSESDSQARIDVESTWSRVFEQEDLLPQNLRVPTIHLAAKRISHATNSLYFPCEIFGMQRTRCHCMKFAQLAVGCSLFSSHFTSNCHFPSLLLLSAHPAHTRTFPASLLFLLSILLLFTLHWPLCCICFQFQQLHNRSFDLFLVWTVTVVSLCPPPLPLSVSRSLSACFAEACSTIATWRIRNQAIANLQLQFRFNTLCFIECRACSNICCAYLSTYGQDACHN